MSGLLYFSSIICVVLFSVAGSGMLEMGDRLIGYMGFVVLGFGVFSSSLLGYLGWKLKSEEVGEGKEINEIGDKENRVQENVKNVFGDVVEKVKRFKEGLGYR